MDRSRYSRLAHRALPISAPIDQGSAEEALALLPLDGGSRVLDVGCGRAAQLLDIVAQRGVHGTGVDLDREALRTARTHAEVLGCSQRVTLLEANALEVSFEAPFDLTLCVGASHAFGGAPRALEQLGLWTRPGGHLLWGDGFWRREPDAEYLAAIGGTKADLSTHYGNVVAAQERGWSLVWSVVTSDAGFDRYEALYRLGMARYLAEHPDDPEADAYRERSERWYTSYNRWGRETMGFALYLLERVPKPIATAT